MGTPANKIIRKLAYFVYRPRKNFLGFFGGITFFKNQ
ncbi:hypothetical protein PEPMIC_00014 [Parvimonas micra ATCC 33270]|uniref:Uncharacterized protein n=1 Tax=Parvimonas micra ATCC 33270 TaxID=411465 RepID=A8SI44_9FIRM|nr:hypothetical protein PEPMIC_00014 [Parvimonas micra ATCC 33270]